MSSSLNTGSSLGISQYPVTLPTAAEHVSAATNCMTGPKPALEAADATIIAITSPAKPIAASRTTMRRNRQRRSLGCVWSTRSTSWYRVCTRLFVTTANRPAMDTHDPQLMPNTRSKSSANTLSSAGRWPPDVGGEGSAPPPTASSWLSVDVSVVASVGISVGSSVGVVVSGVSVPLSIAPLPPSTVSDSASRKGSNRYTTFFLYPDYTVLEDGYE